MCTLTMVYVLSAWIVGLTIGPNHHNHVILWSDSSSWTLKWFLRIVFDVGYFLGFDIESEKSNFRLWLTFENKVRKFSVWLGCCSRFAVQCFWKAGWFLSRTLHAKLFLTEAFVCFLLRSQCIFRLGLLLVCAISEVQPEPHICMVYYCILSD